MLRACAVFKTSISKAPSPNIIEINTNSAQAAIYIAAFANRPNLRKTGAAMVIARRRGDFECSSLSMTICVRRMESVRIGVTPLSMLKTTTVSGSRVVEGESQEHNFNDLSSAFSRLSGEATY